MELITIIIVLALTGIGVGFAEGLLGVGGCFIMVPVTFFVFTTMGFSPDTAIRLAFGSNLLVVFPTAISGAWAHTKKEAVWWKAGMVLGVFGAVGALIGATITSQLLSEEILKPAFGLVIGLGALRMLTWKPSKTEEDLKAEPLLWACWGFPIGIICGMLGLGGGIITVPVLAMALKFKMHHAVGTSLSMMIFTSIAGSIGYLINGLSVPNLPPYSIGYVNLLAWTCLAMTSIPVAQIGARTAHKLPATQIRYIFIAVMFYVALKMVGVFEWLGLPM
ncbi:MAG: sulfite exporter TauE/SafE family protein [Methanophagales archaeon]|nr:sulfite exporter TauE/SafE family protein [Methanophagales archaeon]